MLSFEFDNNNNKLNHTLCKIILFLQVANLLNSFISSSRFLRVFLVNQYLKIVKKQFKVPAN